MEGFASRSMVRSLEDIKPFVVVVGPTASGKSDLGMRLCKEFDGEIISCDSVQVYRDLNIGAAKPSLTDQSQVPHHLIDVADVGQDYDAGRFAKDARQSIFDIQQRGKLAVVVGGTGLYLRGLLGDRFHENLPKDVALRQRLAKKPLHQLYKLLQRLDDERALELHPNDRVRIERALELRILLGHPVSQLPPLEEGLRAKAFLIYLNPPPDLLLSLIHI